jgi:hypothetical protein
MSGQDSYQLWENDEFIICTPTNPHQPYSEGLHIFAAPKNLIGTAWNDPSVAAKTFELCANACAIMKKLNIAPWFNIQVNGNWGLLTGREPYFHVHVFGRNKTDRWGKTILLPEVPGTYSNEPMPERDINLLSDAFKTL